MRVFFVFIYSFTIFFTLTCTSKSELRLVVNPTGHMVGTGPPILVRKVDESLNLTCRLVDHKKEDLRDYNISWNWQYSMRSNANRVMVVSLSRNEANLVFESLKETDSGEYTCKCTELDLHENVRVKVKPFKKFCSDKMFLCSAGHCIGKNFVCDGKPDCKYGFDESYENCGLNPCQGKIPCDDGRCIPASWCCDEDIDPNCTTKVKPRCCQQFTKSFQEHDPTFSEQQFNDMGFLQTTIYTVIGCAMAFMFIVTILVIAICRVHLKRHVISRCPLNHQHLRPSSPLRSTLPLYDIDMLLDRHQDSPGLLVTYNINNGVQFVGRPIDPPPYCEIIDAPPREGPPPPYVSRENLTEVRIENTSAELNTNSTQDNRTDNIIEEAKLLTTDKESDTESVQNEIRSRQVPPEVVSNLKGIPTKNRKISNVDECISLVSLFGEYEPNVSYDNNHANDVINGKNQCTSSLGDMSKFTQDLDTNSSSGLTYDVCLSVPSVSGLYNANRIKILKRNIFTDFSDSESDSSCMENDALLNENSDRKLQNKNIDRKQLERKNSDRKIADNFEEKTFRNSNISNANDNNLNSSGSFINNIAAVSKSLIGSLSKRTESDQKPKLEKFTKPQLVSNRKTVRPFVTQKSFDSSDHCQKELSSNEGTSNFNKIIPTLAHSMGDLSPINTDLNYGDFERRDFLTLPLRESFIGVRNEEL